MAEKNKTETSQCCEPKTKPTGFFQRIFSSIDEKMKAKAEAQASKSSCCGSDDNKGGKCC